MNTSLVDEMIHTFNSFLGWTFTLDVFRQDIAKTKCVDAIEDTSILRSPIYIITIKYASFISDENQDMTTFIVVSNAFEIDLRI